MIPFNMRIVMADDGSKPDWVRMLLRYVGLLIGIVIFFLGVIWAGFDRRKQGLARQDGRHGGRPPGLNPVRATRVPARWSRRSPGRPRYWPSDAPT